MEKPAGMPESTAEKFQDLAKQLLDEHDAYRSFVCGKRRKNIWRLCIISTILMLILAVSHGLTLEQNRWIPLAGMLGLFILFLILLLAFSLEARKLIRQYYKEHLVSALCKHIDPSLKFDPEDGIPEEGYWESGLFPHSVDDYEGEDLVYGQYLGVDVIFSQLHTQYETETTDSNGNTNTSYHTIFKGVFFIADFHKDFQGFTFVLPDIAQNLFGNLIGGFLQKHNIAQLGQLIKMEDVEFEKCFAVYGSSDMETRYLLSPSIMEAMTELYRRFGSDIRFSFVHSKIFIAIGTNVNFFECPSTGKLSEDDLLDTLSQLLLFLNIVEDLDLNVRIWSKE